MKVTDLRVTPVTVPLEAPLRWSMGVELDPEIEAQYPLGRMATPDGIARIAVFLASDDATSITGSHVVVDGGVLAKLH